MQNSIRFIFEVNHLLPRIIEFVICDFYTASVSFKVILVILEIICGGPCHGIVRLSAHFISM